MTLVAAIGRARELAARPGRTLLGITGAPGAGKSSVAAALTRAVAGSVIVPMDGFHRTTAELDALGWVSERGTPRTFDAEGYVALLRRLRSGHEVSAPSFDRSREEPVPDAIHVAADVRLVITEGNYLLLDAQPWAQIRSLLDEVWYLEVAEAVRVERLVARHVEFGRSTTEARQRVVFGSDAGNAELVRASASRADLVIDAAELDR